MAKMNIQKIYDLYGAIEEEVDSTLLKKGINPNPNNPELPDSLQNIVEFVQGDPTIKGSLTSYSDVQIGDLQSFFLYWLAFLNAITATYEFRLLITKSRKTDLEAGLRQFLKEKGIKQASLKDETRTYTLEGQDIPIMVQVEQSLLISTGLHLKAEARNKSVSKILATISREQTRRETELKANTRTYNAQNKSVPRNSSPSTGNARWR